MDLVHPPKLCAALPVVIEFGANDTENHAVPRRAWLHPLPTKEDRCHNEQKLVQAEERVTGLGTTPTRPWRWGIATRTAAYARHSGWHRFPNWIR